MKTIGKSGAAIATAAFALAVSGTAMIAPTTAVADDKVMCAGVNSCKGHGDCATASNACKGQNSCKGHGVMSMSAEECTEKGGTYES